jgi:hypothetical protein
MEYLKRIEAIEKGVSSKDRMIFALMALFGLFMIVIPQALKNSNPVVIQTQTGAEIATTTPWKLSEARIERFTNAYLAARFQWDAKSFVDQRKQLGILTDDAVLTKLKAFEGLAQNQDARSYYVLESPPSWDGRQKIEAHVTRVLRIQSAALATPLVVRLSYMEAPVTPENPYGLRVTELDESQPGGGR